MGFGYGAKLTEEEEEEEEKEELVQNNIFAVFRLTSYLKHTNSSYKWLR